MDSETICHYCGEKLPHEKCTEVKKPEPGEFTKEIEQKYNGTNHWADWVIEIDLKKACKEIDRLAMQRDYKDKAIKRLRKKQKNQAKAINFLVAKLKAKDLTIKLIKDHAAINFDNNLLALIAEIEKDPAAFDKALKG